MIYKKEDIDKLIENLDIVEVVGEYVELKKSGQNYKGRCPFHKEKTPSFVVNPEKNIFKCFGCGEAGNALSFYEKINNLEFIEAVEELAKKKNAPLTPIRGDYKKAIQTNKKKYQLLEDAADYFMNNIFEEKNKKALIYLKDRGLSEEFIKNYKLGYAVNDWNALSDYMYKKGYTEKELIDVALIKVGEKGNYDTFRDRIMFPIHSNNGNIIAFGGRILDNNKNIAKYLNSPETVLFQKSDNLYGILKKGSIIRKRGFSLLMEGYMDVLTAHKYGFDNAIASLGTSFTEGQAKLLQKYTKNIVLCYDMDSAGRKATERTANILKKYEFNVKVLELSGVKDPDDYLRKFGKEKFIESLKKSKEIFDYLYFNYSLDINLSEIIEKKNLIKRFKDFFNNLSELEFGLYAEKLAINIGLDKKLIELELKPKIKPKFNNYKKNRIEIKSSLQKDKLEYETIRLIIKNKKYYKEFGMIEIKDELYQKILLLIENNEKENIFEKINQNDLFDKKEKRELIDLIYSVDEIENEEDFFEELKFSWNRRNKEAKEKELKNKLLDENLSLEEKKNILYERYELIKKLKN
ncbi:MAG: DNA primase [Fusobacteriia bacterium 4572_132]|nr:MAG: DNA primase [Fusobacteriia bacterium 4572_132]